MSKRSKKADAPEVRENEFLPPHNAVFVRPDGSRVVFVKGVHVNDQDHEEMPMRVTTTEVYHGATDHIVRNAEGLGLEPMLIQSDEEHQEALKRVDVLMSMEERAEGDDLELRNRTSAIMRYENWRFPLEGVADPPTENPAPKNADPNVTNIDVPLWAAGIVLVIFFLFGYLSHG